MASVSYCHKHILFGNHLPNISDWDLGDLIVVPSDRVWKSVINLRFIPNLIVVYEFESSKLNILLLRGFKPDEHWSRICSSDGIFVCPNFGTLILINGFRILCQGILIICKPKSITIMPPPLSYTKQFCFWKYK